MKNNQLEVRKVMMRLTREEYIKLKSLCVEKDIFIQDALHAAVLEMLDKGLPIRDDG